MNRQPQPRKPLVAVPRDLLDAITQLAQREHRTTTAQIEHMLRESMAKEQIR